MNLKRCQRRRNGKKDNYYIDLDTGLEVNYGQRKERNDIGKRRVPEEISKAKAAASAYSRRYRVNAGFKDEFTLLVTAEAKALVKLRALETNIAWDLDHMLPMKGATVSGLHCADNIQVIPAKLNRMKNNKLKYTERMEWLNELKA